MTRFTLLLLAGLALTSAGCLAVAAVGAAGAGAATYVYLHGNVSQQYHATFADGWQAVAAALKEQGLPLVHQENDGNSGTITSKGPAGDDREISIHLSSEPGKVQGEGTILTVTVRVGWSGDQAYSENLLARIGSHLVPPGLAPAGTPPGTPPKLGPIQQAGWNNVTETGPPPELPAEPVPVPHH
jgi:hypothetical protein